MNQSDHISNEITRRHFLELTGTGLASAFVLGGSYANASDPVRGGSLNCGVHWLMQAPDPQRFTGASARPCIALSWEGLTTPTSLAERHRLLKEHGPDAAIPEVQPMLADNWEIEKDGTRYVFNLKKGVKFHNGKEFEAEDVAWGWKRIQDPIHFSANRKFLSVYLGSIETPDRYTVVANLSRPYGGFLMANAWCFAAILPKNSIPYGAIWGDTPTFQPDTTAPPGTGPFVMTEYQQNHQAVYERFSEYRIPELPYLEKIVYKVMGEIGTRTLALRAGNLDYASTVDSNWLAKKMKGRGLNTPYFLSDEKNL